MSGYELRAEHQPADPVGRETVRWHVVRRRHLVAMCGRLIDPVSELRPIQAAEDIAPECRCTDCWDWWTVVQEAHSESTSAAVRAAGPAGGSLGSSALAPGADPGRTTTGGRQPWPSGP